MRFLLIWPLLTSLSPSYQTQPTQFSLFMYGSLQGMGLCTLFTSRANTDVPQLMMGLCSNKPTEGWKYHVAKNSFNASNLPNIIVYQHRDYQLFILVIMGLIELWLAATVQSLESIMSHISSPGKDQNFKGNCSWVHTAFVPHWSQEKKKSLIEPW